MIEKGTTVNTPGPVTVTMLPKGCDAFKFGFCFAWGFSAAVCGVVALGATIVRVLP